jgi:Bacterial Ig-like domain
MSEPTTALHYTANGNFVNGQYAPGADGFNLADVSSTGELSEVPSGDKALVWLGMSGGVTAAFEAAVEPYIGNSQVYGFYLADEPDPSATTAANFKAESDWIHANDPGAKTFIIEENSSSDTTPQYYYTPANSDIDLFGLDPYPVNTNVPNNYDLNTIPLAVQAAESIGIPQQDLVPVYQAFGGGGYASWILPTATQEQAILSEWGSVLPNPAFDYAYSWGSQDGDTALSQDPALQQVFAAHNSGGSGTSGSGGSGTGGSGGSGTGGSAPAAPTIGDSSVQGGLVNAANDTAAQTLSGTAGAGDTVEVYLNGSTTPSYSTVANSSGAWSVKIGVLANGAYSYTATATDPAGDTSASSAALEFTVDPVAPAAPTIGDSSVQGGLVNAANDTAAQTLSGTAGAGDTVKIYLNGSTTASYSTLANASGNWSVKIGALGNGAYSYAATATDATGDTSASSAALKFTVDTVAPAAPTIGDSSIQGGIVNAANDTAAQTLSGTAGAGDTVKVYLNGSTTPSYSVLASTSGGWSADIGVLANGAYSYTATATNPAGDISASSAALNFTVDTQASGQSGQSSTPSGQPTTALHYTANGNFVNGQYAPGADGFNLADVSSTGELSEVPSGDKALVWLGMSGGVTAAFEAAVEPYIGNSQVYGFYLADEPDPSATTAANFKAESDWIHANDPGAKTFIIEENSSSDTTPQYYYTPANSDIDLFGLDPYPVNTNVPNNYDLNTIPLAVQAAESIGIPQQDLVPVYQAFGGGGYASWILPTATQEQAILSEWGSVLPNPAFDYAYSWGSQDGDTALSQDPALQQVFAAHNSGGSTAQSSAAIQPASAATTSSSVQAASPSTEFANSIALLNGNNMGAHLAIGSADTLQSLTSGSKLAAAAELQPNPAVHS